MSTFPNEDKSKRHFTSISEFREAVASEHEQFVYGRGAHPTVRAVCERIALLDRKEAALAFSSGMGAISSLFGSLLRAGDHVILMQSIYSWTRHFALSHLNRFGVEVSWIEPGEEQNPDIVSRLIRPNTKLLFLELPTYFLHQLPQFHPWLEAARKSGVETAADLTYFGPGSFRRPESLDYCLYSGTKFIVGNGKDLCGFITCTRDRSKYLFREGLMSFGSVLSFRSAREVDAGLSSLAERTIAMSSVSREVQSELLKQIAVRKILSPFVRERTFCDISEFSGVPGLFSIELATGDPLEVEDFCHRLRVFRLGVSYGAPEALAMPALVFQRPGHDIQHPTGLIRLALGAQHSAEEHLADLIQAIGAFR